MWYVFFKEDSWECGWSVKSREEAERFCENNPDYCFVYVG